MFFHDKHQIHYFDLNDDFAPKNLKKIALETDIDEQETFIDQLRMSSNSDIIAIVLIEDEGSVIFKWHVQSNTEIYVRDV